MQAIDALAQARRDGRRVALVTVLAVEGDAPSHPGAKLLADHSGPIAGTLGCSEFDAAGLELARQALDGRRTVRRRLEFPGHGEQRAIELFAEVQEPEPGVIVVGGNPVGRAVADVAVAVGRRVKLIATERGEAVEHPGVQVAIGDPSAIVGDHGLAQADAVVVSDHDAPWVDDVLRIALASPAGFVGMLGSRRHAPQAVQRLRDHGVDEAHLARLHSPVGLDIGGRTPGEIALSIVAEIVAHERGRPGGPMTIDWSRR
ncbi:MAG TPA: XdhC family protein [Euzebyales bacterium]|nr:XdhC family protein [Euzebyales bacterium]